MIPKKLNTSLLSTEDQSIICLSITFIFKMWSLEHLNVFQVK